MAAEIPSVAEPGGAVDEDMDADTHLSTLWVSEPSIPVGDTVFARRFMVQARAKR